MKVPYLMRSIRAGGLIVSLGCTSGFALASEAAMDSTATMAGYIAVDAPAPGLIGDATFDSVADDRAVPLVHIAKPVVVAPLAAPSDGLAPMQLGQGVALAHAEVDASRLQWQRLPDNRWAGRFEIKADEAGGLRAALRIRSADGGPALPDAVLSETRFHFGGANREVYESSAKEIIENDNFWSPLIKGDTLYVEVVLPVGASRDAMRIDLPRLSYFPKPAMQALYSNGFGSSYHGQIDVVCRPPTQDLKTLSAAVAKMTYTNANGWSYGCSGTLLDNRNVPKRSLFMTAKHCIEDQASARSLQTVWFYDQTVCGGGASTVNPRAVTLNSGARLLLAHATLDSSLVELNSRPPIGANYQGWRSDPIRYSEDVVALHHPSFDVKKYTDGYVSRRLPGYRRADIMVHYGDGGVEGGSSGSGLFTNGGNGYVFRGNLSGGSGGSLDTWFRAGHYADFSQFYPSVSHYFGDRG
ncbi:trypsin-like peptidase domain-containing protein [Robbsia sp. KACC 23696]|uniref:trypsin-like peptidase domain-containing protein n=1 Tax=Robbsia sp. KACC 23696 TaxID=3149231 RepID=UPI00325AC80F